MKFFKRRKLLKSTNYLDLTPVRLMEYTVTEPGKVDILLPRFRKGFWREAYKRSAKGEYIFIHLDEPGSTLWLMIDGSVKVRDLCNMIIEKRPDLMQPREETEKRVTQFLSLLYHEKYITFLEIR